MRLFCSLLLLTTAVAAQDLTHKAPPQEGPVVLRNGTIHTVSGETISKGYVLFQKGRITAIGADAPQPWPAGTAIVDLDGKHVYPGLIAPHTRLGLTEIGAVRATRDFDEVGAVTPEARAAVAINPDSTLLPVTRTNGVLLTGVFPSGGLVPGRASVVRLEGWTWEDMAVRADAGLVLAWPQMRPIRAPWMDQGAAAQRRDTEAQIRRLREIFARAEAYHRKRRAEATATDVRWEGMRSVLPPQVTGADPKDQRPVFVLAQDYDQITAAMEFCVERKLKLVIVGGRDAHLCLKALKQQDVGVLLTGVFMMPKRRDSDYDAVFGLPKKLHAAGVRWCLAGGDRTGNVRNLPYAAGLATAHGLDPKAAIRAITLDAARILGVDHAYGSLEKGKSATLIVTTGDPLEITTRVTRAYIDGRRIDLSNKQTKLHAKYREKYRQLGLLDK